MKQYLPPRTLQCMGNFHSRLTKERHGCVLCGIHSSLQHLEGKEFSVGGGQVVKRFKERAEDQAQNPESSKESVFFIKVMHRDIQLLNMNPKVSIQQQGKHPQNSKVISPSKVDTAVLVSTNSIKVIVPPTPVPVAHPWSETLTRLVTIP